MDKLAVYGNKFDLFKAHYVDPEGVPLTEADKEEWNRWHFADNLIRSGRYRKKTVVKMLETEFHCSRATAYRVLANTISFFNSISPKGKNYYTEVYAEQFEEYARSAAAMQEFDVAGRNLMRAAKVRGLDRDDPDMPDFEKMQPHVYELNVPKNLLEVLRVLLSKGAVDLSQLRNDNDLTEDANYSDVTNQPAQSGESNNP